MDFDTWSVGLLPVCVFFILAVLSVVFFFLPFFLTKAPEAHRHPDKLIQWWEANLSTLETVHTIWKSTDQGKQREKPQCSKCGRVGHLESACYAKTPAKDHKAVPKLAKAPPKEVKQPVVTKEEKQEVKLPVANASQMAEKVCFQCGEAGHIRKDCPKAKKKLHPLYRQFSCHPILALAPSLISSMTLGNHLERTLF